MNIEELFAGIGVVIDDKVFANEEQTTDHIITIVNQLENKHHFPLVKYAYLPLNENLAMMGNISFLLLDWEFDSRDEIFGGSALDVSVGDSFKADNEKRVIEIVQEVSKKGMVPIFIFSNQNRDTIKAALKKAKIDTTKSQIYIESKSNLVGEGELMSKIEAWVDEHSGIYVAKAWGNVFVKARNEFFAEMCNNTSHWPKAVYHSAVDDNVDPGEEMTRSVSQNIMSRMFPIEINQEQIYKDRETPNKEEVLGIMKGQFFVEKECATSIVGDFYKCKDKYYINIRPTCDCIERESNSGLVYLLECSQLSNGQIKSYQGHLVESPDCAMVGPLFKGKFYRISFKNLYVVQESECRDKKVGRILPPVITHVAERYGLYVQRQALPRLPKEILPDSEIDKVEVANDERTPSASTVLVESVANPDKDQNSGCMAAIINSVKK